MMTQDAQLRAEILKLVETYYEARFTKRAFNPEADIVHYAGRVFDAKELINLVDSSLDFFLTASQYS